MVSSSSHGLPLLAAKRERLERLRRRRCATVEQREDEIRILDGFFRPLHAELFHRVRRLADAGGVDEPQQYAAERRLFLHGIARRAPRCP